MVQGTMSNAGKSLLAAGLCRIFAQDGYKVAPFKSQNMALNSFITEEGLEMGRAQVMQAEAAGIKPSVYMIPILLKPTNDVGSQVIVNGEVLGNMPAREYFAFKKQLIPKVQEAFDHLAAEYDIIVIEGAGSPAEINLKKDDLVNMGMAKMAKAPVLLVGDIDRGGVFVQLVGTVMLLTEEEKKLVSQVCENFPEVIVILNVNGLIDLEWTTKYTSVKSILFLGLPGEGGAKAVAEIIKGNVSPSGKLAFTIAHRYEDYPSAKHFSWDKEKEEHILTYEDYGLDAEENGSFGFRKSPVTVYQEDIYNGYRYFSSFGKEVLFPFGHGLSYTKFALDAAAVSKEEDGITIIIDVKNVGLCAGREVVQIYVSMPDGKTEKAERELKGFAKTEVLKPGEKTSVSIHIPWDGLSCYEEKSSVWLIEKGRYKLRMGTSSEETVCICELDVSEDIIYSICRSALGLKACNDGKLTFLKKNCLKDQELPSDACGGVCEENPMYKLTLSGIDVKPEKREAGQGRQVRDFSDFTEEQLAALLVGYGSGIPFAGFLDTAFPETICDKEGKPLTCNDHPAGHNGYVSPAIKDKGIHSVFYMDGPAGIGRTAWPTEMLLACAFNKEAWYRFGEAVGAECEEAQVDVWLAPAVNLHRNPLCGRNFEYFSEDPFLTGVCACAITKGVQENHQVLVCPKHFAVNEQETYRRGNAKKQYDAVDSVITERAARELYLKPFEMLVKKANVRCIMTSFNKINGIFAGGNSDLCNRILREEWGYEGFLVTDWGDMDIVVDGADAVAAGNDVVMPGGPPVIKQILNGYREGRVTRRQLETAASHLLRVIKSLKGRNGKNGKEDI